MNHETRFRVFALSVIYLMRTNVDGLPCEAYSNMKLVEAALLAGSPTDMMSSWVAMEAALRRPRNLNTTLAHSATGHAMCAVSEARRADNRAIRDGEDAEGADRWSGPFRELNSACERAKQAYELVIRMGVSPATLEAFRPLLPEYVFAG